MPTTQKMRSAEDKTIIRDFTDATTIVPREQTLLEDLGLWSETNTEYLYTDSIEIEREIMRISDMPVNARDAERNYLGASDVQSVFFKVPFRTLDTKVTPKDRFALRKYGTVEQDEQVSNLVFKKVQATQKSHGRMHRLAQYTALVDNKVYAKDAAGNDVTSLAKNFSNVWDAPRLTKTLNLSEQKDPFIELEEVRQKIITNAGDNGDNYQLIFIVSSSDFQALTHHPDVEAAYSQYRSADEPLRKRLSGNRNNQMFTHQGITIISDISGQIANGKGYLLPLDFEDMFVRLYAPANTLDDDGVMAKEMYLWTKESRRVFVMESEVAVAYLINRPELICDVTINA